MLPCPKEVIVDPGIYFSYIFAVVFSCTMFSLIPLPIFFCGLKGVRYETTHQVFMEAVADFTWVQSTIAIIHVMFGYFGVDNRVYMGRVNISNNT